MEVGRYLDARVAAKVMEWKQIDSISWSEPAPSGLAYQRLLHEIPEYSTDIAAAWEVVEKIKDMGRGTDLTIEIELSAEYPDECTVRIQWLDTDPNKGACGPFYITGKTAPHSICLAALKVVGA